eukprot:36123-Chlamydomonas_euryale.AAC.3
MDVGRTGLLRGTGLPCVRFHTCSSLVRNSMRLSSSHSLYEPMPRYVVTVSRASEWRVDSCGHGRTRGGAHSSSAGSARQSTQLIGTLSSTGHSSSAGSARQGTARQQARMHERRDDVHYVEEGRSDRPASTRECDAHMCTTSTKAVQAGKNARASATPKCSIPSRSAQFVRALRGRIQECVVHLADA